ncbi:MAG: lysylphosphatidylglycerol synthase transmembrane domain-containing protein [Patescibacteria group bacterium]|jgi:uncharacterized membrane protein YbhN (UPF0104 family)
MRLKVIIRYVFLVITVVFIGYLFSDNLGKLKVLLEISIPNFVVLSILALATFVANGIKNVLLLRPFKVRLRFTEWFGLSVVNSFWNYLPFQGGLVAKGMYLKRQHQFAYTEYASTVSASYLITFFTFGLVGCAGLALAYFMNHALVFMPVLIYTVLAVVPLIAVIIISRGESWCKRFPRLARFFSGARIIFKDKKTVTSLVLLDVGMLAVYVARLALCFSATGLHVDFYFIILVTPIALLSIFFTITPGGLVVREALIGLFAFWYSLNVGDIVVASLLDRAVLMVWVFGLGLVFNYFLSRRVFGDQRPPDPPADRLDS